MLVFVVGVLVLFNTGQIVNKKVELDNTADAAAYSAAVQQARAYNVIAYLNRAQVANEVATAQMVSLQSWMNYVISGSGNFAKAANIVGTILDFVPFAEEIGIMLNETAAALNEAKTALTAMRNGMKPVFSSAILALSALNAGYAKVTGLITDAEVADVPYVVDKVVKLSVVTTPGSTDKAASLGVASLGELSAQAVVANHKDVRIYSVPEVRPPATPPRTADAERYRSVVMEARDGFSKSRSQDLFALFHKRGGTDLVGYNRWVGMDTLEAKSDLPFPFDIFNIDVPMAWGGAAAVYATAPYSTLAAHDPGWKSLYPNDRGNHAAYDGAANNGEAGKLARLLPAMPVTEAILTNYRGLHPYEDVNGKTVASVPYAQSGSPDDTEGPVFTVLVEQKMTDVSTTSNLHMGAPAGSAPVLGVALQAPDAAQNKKMTALASAQVYFDRPRTLFPRADGQRELGSLFSPYWQARLVDTPRAIKVILFGTSAL
jgi:hypothetical protein